MVIYITIDHIDFVSYICIVCSRYFFSISIMLLSDKLKLLRESARLPQRKLSAALDIDTATYSKIENGLYLPRREIVIAIAQELGVDQGELLKLWMADRITSVAQEDRDLAVDALRIVEESIR